MTPNEHAIADSAKILEIALSDEDSPAATLARRHWLKTRAGVSVKTADRVNHEILQGSVLVLAQLAGRPSSRRRRRSRSRIITGENVKHFKQDLRQVEMQRRAGRDAERAVFNPAVNVSGPTRRTDGARVRRSYAVAYVDQGDARAP